MVRGIVTQQIQNISKFKTLYRLTFVNNKTKVNLGNFFIYYADRIMSD